MTKEIIIHLGDMKTGSTALQSVLRFGDYNWSGGSICYPGKHLHHNYLAGAVRSGKSPDLIAKRMEAIGEELRASDADFGVVSAELFEFVPAERMQELIQTYWPDLADRIRFVAYVRPHAPKLLALYSTHMRFGSKVKGPQTECVNTSKTAVLDYAPRFNAWRACFGDRFSLRLFDRAHLHNGDVVQDFFHFMNPGAEVELTGEPIANASLTVAQIALLRLFLKPFHDTPDRSPQQREACATLCRFVARKIEQAGLGKDSGRVHIPNAIISTFIDRYHEDARALDAAFFEGNPMEQALLDARKKYAGPRQSLEASDYFSSDTLTSFAILGQVMCASVNTGSEHVKELALKLLHEDWGTQ